MPDEKSPVSKPTVSPLAKLLAFRVPAESWEDFLARFVQLRATPGVQDFYNRWDVKRYICTARPLNGKPAEIDAHTAHQSEPGKCKCGRPLMESGNYGLGEFHAHLAWLAERMEAGEAQWFQMHVLPQHKNELLEKAIIPTLRAILKGVR